MKRIKFPARYIPKNISKKDKKKQLGMLLKSKRMYKNKKYFTRKKVSSYKNKKSNHISDARKIYNIENMMGLGTPEDLHYFLEKTK